jgi:hypothetical protein
MNTTSEAYLEMTANTETRPARIASRHDERAERPHQLSFDIGNSERDERFFLEFAESAASSGRSATLGENGCGSIRMALTLLRTRCGTILEVVTLPH